MPDGFLLSTEDQRVLREALTRLDNLASSSGRVSEEENIDGAPDLYLASVAEDIATVLKLRDDDAPPVERDLDKTIKQTYGYPIIGRLKSGDWVQLGEPLNRYLLFQNLYPCSSANAQRGYIREYDSETDPDSYENDPLCRWVALETVTLVDIHGTVAGSALAANGYIPSGCFAIGKYWQDSGEHEPLVFGDCECEASPSPSPECITSIGGIGLEGISIERNPDYGLAIKDGCLVRTPTTSCDDSPGPSPSP